MQKLNLRMQKLNLRMQKLNLRMQKLDFPGTHWRGLALIGAQKTPTLPFRPSQSNSQTPHQGSSMFNLHVLIFIHNIRQ